MSTDRSRRSPAPARLGHIVVVGCGLIGGSILRRLASLPAPPRLTAADRAPVRAVLQRAQLAQAVLAPGRVAPGLAELGADVVVLAMPVDAILRVLPALAAAARELPAGRRPLILDVASVKAPVVAAARACALPRFVGGHPMAGGERAGLSHSRPDLFLGRPFVLCPTTRVRRDLARARSFVRALGGRPLVLDPVTHDRSVALVSHLPHVAAWSLLDAATRLRARLGRPGLPLRLAASSWRDATRVAASDVGLWSGILRHNQDALLESLDLFLDALSRVRAGLADPDGHPLRGGASGVAAARLRRLGLRARRP